MGRSIALAAYLAVRRLSAGSAVPPLPPRPPGPLVWFQARLASDLRAAVGLFLRLRDRNPALLGVLACPPSIAPTAAETPEGLLVQPPLPERPRECQRVLDHWRPAALIVLGTDLPPVTIVRASDAGIALYLANARDPLVPLRSWRRLGGMVASLLQRFDRVMASDDAAARRLRRSGVRPWRLETTGPLEDAPLPLAHNDAEREALARQLRGRPVWLAARLPQSEEATVLAAHARSLRHLHRLLLVVVPEDPAQGPRLAEQAAAPALGGTAPLRVALRSRDDDLTDQTEVYIADTEGELGLWFRLAPMTFLGGSLAGPFSLSHPFGPALLGSVVLHGPMRARYGNAIERLCAAGASVAVDTAPALAEAVVDLAAPDRAARRAQAAWSVVTAGAEATDRLADLLLTDLSDRAAAAAVQGGPRKGQGAAASLSGATAGR